MSNGLVSGNVQNGAGGNTPHNRSKFNLSYQLYDTHRFGEYHPFFVMESVDSDNVGARCSHDVRSYTLKAPLMQDIKMKKDYFAVPYQAILPLNWEKVYTNPTVGDDVSDDVGCGVTEFFSAYGSFVSSLYSALSSYASGSNPSTYTEIQALLRFLVVGEYVYSNGSLMASLGIHAAPYLQFAKSGDNHVYCFDDFFDAACAWLVGTGIKGFVIGDATESGVDDSHIYYVDVANERSAGSIYFYTTGGVTYPSSVISLRQALEIFRDEPSVQVPAIDLGTVTAATFRTSFSNLLAAWSLSDRSSSDIPLNLSRLWAYQICCAHFYSNDHIDYIYSANLFREYIGYLTDTLFAASAATGPTNDPANGFTYNGIKYQYDNLCANVYTHMISVLSSYASNVLTSTSAGVAVYGLPYLAALFSYKRSLRFLDYFTGSRSRPLAIGDVNVDVNSGASGSYVNVVDVTRNIQRQRFFNAVNRAGRKFSSYMKELFGKAPAHDFHDPMYLGHTADVIFGSEVENTGAAQLTDANSVTSVLRSNASRYGFEFSSDRDQIIIGICYYDLSRNYSRSIERQNFHMNRFDMFNPYMQFIGDQEIYSAELNPELGIGSYGLIPFAYTNRHMEYKQRYNQAAGGFVKALPSWLFLADQDMTNGFNKINPSYIRSFPSELDRFYVSLTGYSLGTYFHFIVRSTNEVTASRPMAYAPSIL